MAAVYSIKELRGVPLSGPCNGAVQIDFLVFRDSLLIGPYKLFAIWRNALSSGLNVPINGLGRRPTPRRAAPGGDWLSWVRPKYLGPSLFGSPAPYRNKIATSLKRPRPANPGPVGASWAV